MAYVTDPDDLDRWQVLLDPTAETLAIKGLGTVRSPKQTDGVTTISTGTFTSALGDFVTNGVVANDVLIIASNNGAVIGHYIVVTRDSATQLTVTPTFAASKTSLTYRVQTPTSAAGPSGGKVGDGVTMQALYSFLKEEWRSLSDVNMPELNKFLFPLESITSEQFEIGGTTHSNWDFKDNNTRNLIRTGGWQQISSAGTVQKDYAGIITLGSLDSDAQVYYLQTNGGTPSNFILTGTVNQAILTYTDGGDNLRSFLKLFVRKKKRSYAQSEIADIGVTSIKTIVNRFPLTHATDPAIIVSDGVLSGDGTGPNVAFQNVVTVDSSKTDGVVSDPVVGDGLFRLVSAASLFQTTNKVSVGDTVQLTDGSDQGVYEISSVDSETQLTLFQEPGFTITGGSGVDFTTRTKIRHAGAADGVTSDPTPNDGLGQFDSATVANWTTAGVVAGDMLQITAATTAENIGIYKITLVEVDKLTINIIDNENWTAEGSTTWRILRAGMHLQFKSKTITISSTGDITFANANPDTITRASGSWISDTVVAGDIITITGSVSNNGSFTVASRTATIITLVATDSLIAEGPLAVTTTCKRGFTRTLNGIKYGFNWRQFGNGGTLAESFQWLQRQLRRSTDIDDSTVSSRGDITSLLQAFASPNTTTTNLVIDDVAAADLNNLTQKDITSISRNDAFLTSITISLNANINNATSKKLNVYFTNSPNQFGTVAAVLVQDKDSVDMTKSDGQLNGSTVTFAYNYDATQNGHGGGSDEAITIVCLGTDQAQYVKATGTIQRKNENTFSVVAPLERNYNNP